MEPGPAVVDPHFLFNTIGTIVSFRSHGSPRRPARCSSTFSNYYRQTPEPDALTSLQTSWPGHAPHQPLQARYERQACCASTSTRPFAVDSRVPPPFCSRYWKKLHQARDARDRAALDRPSSWRRVDGVRIVVEDDGMVQPWRRRHLFDVKRVTVAGWRGGGSRRRQASRCPHHGGRLRGRGWRSAKRACASIFWRGIGYSGWPQEGVARAWWSPSPGEPHEPEARAASAQACCGRVRRWDAAAAAGVCGRCAAAPGRCQAVVARPRVCADIDGFWCVSFARFDRALRIRLVVTGAARVSAPLRLGHWIQLTQVTGGWQQEGIAKDDACKAGGFMVCTVKLACRSWTTSRPFVLSSITCSSKMRA